MDRSILPKIFNKLYSFTYKELRDAIRKTNAKIRLNLSHLELRLKFIEFLMPQIKQKYIDSIRKQQIITTPPIIAPQEPRVKKLNQKLQNFNPTLPVFVQAQGTFSVKNHAMIRQEKYVRFIDTPEKLASYKRSLLSKLMNYEFTSMHPRAIFTNLSFLIDPIIEPQKIVRVAEYKLENCVLNVIRRYLSADKLDKLYKAFPHLNQDNVYLSQDQIDKIGKFLRVKLQIFTKLGMNLGQPWATLGSKGNKKTIPIQVQCEHATMIQGRLAVKHIKYYLPPLVHNNETNVTEVKVHNNTIQYFTTVDDDELTIHKFFRPSTVTKNKSDDTNLAFAYTTTTEQLLFQLFKLKYNLTPIPDQNIRDVVKQAENFIGHKVISHIPQNAEECDHNKNYISYETLQEYVGFPTNHLIATTLNNAINPAFIVTEIHNAPDYFYHFYQQKSAYTLTMPVYNFIKNYATTNPLYVLDHPKPFQQVSIKDFTKNYQIQQDQVKLFRNQLIGRTITGGVKENRNLQCPYSNNTERLQLVHEAQYNDYSYNVDEDNKIVNIEIPNTKPGLFNFHSYILGYAAIHMMKQWQFLTDNNATIHAYNVDALVYTMPTNPTYLFQFNSNDDGAWKYGFPKPYYQNFNVTPDFKVNNMDPIILPHPEHPTTNTIITGPGGIGKSHPFLSDPFHGQIILTPTKELRDNHKKYYRNTFTAHKYFQFQADDDTFNTLRRNGSIPRHHNVIIIDELTMFSKHEWDIILNRSNGATIIALGDFEQIISQNNNQTPITEEYFAKHSFKTRVLNRTPTTVSRHAYNYGSQLDQLRQKDFDTQLTLIQSIFTSTTRPDYQPTTRVVTGTHHRANYFNNQAKLHLKEFPVKDRKNMQKILPTDDKFIWWGRTKQSQVMPKEFRYEPIYAVTSDSIQGKTYNTNLFIDQHYLSRHGALYTAVTRTTTPDNTILLD